MLMNMTKEQWNQTARHFADHMGQFRHLVERGVAPIRFLEEATMADVTDCPVVVGVFGNDNLLSDTARREMDLVRDQAKERSLHELGAACSEDGSTWALLIGVEHSPYTTVAGQTFQREMMKWTFEDIVRSAWRNVAVVSDHADRPASLTPVE